MHVLHMNTFLLIRHNVRQTEQFEALIPPIILECRAALNKPTLEPPYEPSAVKYRAERRASFPQFTLGNISVQTF